MNAVTVVVSALLYLPAAAFAADAEVRLTLEGRPVDRNPGSAIMHGGAIYADAIALTKCFNGFITLRRDDSATITVGPNTGTFRAGSRIATINNVVVGLPGAPFMRNGDLFVPLDSFVSRIAAVGLLVDPAHHRADIRISGLPR